MREFFRGFPSSAGAAAFTIYPSDHVNTAVFSGAGAKSISVPAGARFVVFAASGDFYAAYDGAAAVPSADISDGSGSELNPTQRELPDGIATIGLAVDAACTITLGFYL